MQISDDGMTNGKWRPVSVRLNSKVIPLRRGVHGFYLVMGSLPLRLLCSVGVYSLPHLLLSLSLRTRGERRGKEATSRLEDCRGRGQMSAASM